MNHIEVITPNDGVTYHIEHATAKEIEAGFDYTEFKEPEDFKQVCEEHDLQPEGPISVPSATGSDSIDWAWSNEHVVLITDHDPITGEKDENTSEDNIEPGYAGMMAIQGELEYVETLYDALNEHAVYVKSHNFGDRNYI